MPTPTRKPTISGTMSNFLNLVRPSTNGNSNHHLAVPTSSMKYSHQSSSSTSFVATTYLHGKVAVVTGSSRSLGAAIAQCLGEHGANVVINYTSDTDLKSANQLVQSIRSQGKGGAISVKADTSTPEGGHLLLQETIKTFGKKIDILVLNAGIGIGSGSGSSGRSSRGLEEVDEELFDRYFSVNVKAPLFMAKMAVPLLSSPGGRIIFFSSNMTSTSASVQPGSLCYLATKGAIEQIARVLSKELGPRGINVNTISPGHWLWDDDHDNVANTGNRESSNKNPGIIDFSIVTSKRKHGGPAAEDIAPIVAFLASEAAQWINGQNIQVDGGFQ